MSLTQLPNINELLLPMLKLAGEQKELSCQLATRLLAEQYGIAIGQDSRLHVMKDLKSLHTKVGWAINYLKNANLLNSTRRGYFEITMAGQEVLAYPPKQLSRHSLTKYRTTEEGKSRKGVRKKREKAIGPVTSLSVTLPGVFYEITRTEEGEIQFNHCPQPLLPLEAKTGAFFESIVLVKNAVSAQPDISPEALYQKLVSWAGQYHPNGIQVAFDALSMAGVLPQDDWNRELEQQVTLSLPEGVSLAELRKLCLQTICCRVSKMPDILHALAKHPQPSLRDLFTLLNQKVQMADLNLRLHLLTDLGAVIYETPTWRLSSIGRELAKVFSIRTSDNHPAVTKSSSSSNKWVHVTKETNNNVIDPIDETSFYCQKKTEEIKLSLPEKDLIDNHMFTSLQEAIRIIFPQDRNAVTLVKKHFWNNPHYIGEAEHSMAAWKGWSANLSTISAEYGTVYMDLVNNVLPVSARSALFGEVFSQEISAYKSFVVMYVGSLPLLAENEIMQQGFLIRKMGKTFHASIVVEVSRFYQETAFHWAAHIARLIIFSKGIRSKYQDTLSTRSIL